MMPSAQIKNYILLKDLNGGTDGRVWMACSPSGRVCVLKFDRVDSYVLNSTDLWNEAIEKATERFEYERKVYIQQTDMTTNVVILEIDPCSLRNITLLLI